MPDEAVACPRQHRDLALRQGTNSAPHGRAGPFPDAARQTLCIRL